MLARSRVRVLTSRAAGAQARSFSKPNISAQTVKELRDKTGSPMMDCKRALEEVAHMHAAAHLWFPWARLCSAGRASFWAFMRARFCQHPDLRAHASRKYLSALEANRACLRLPVHRVQSNGDLQGAIDFLRQKGMATAAKKVHLFCGRVCGTYHLAARTDMWRAFSRFTGTLLGS
jgi:hypothetical protein